MYAVRWHRNVQRTHGEPHDPQALAPDVPRLSPRRSSRLRDPRVGHGPRKRGRRRPPRRRGDRRGPVAGAAPPRHRRPLAALHRRGDDGGVGARGGRHRSRHRGPGPRPHRRRSRCRRGRRSGHPAPQPHLGRDHGGRLGAGVADLRRRARPAGGRGLRRLRRQRRAGRHRADGPGAPPRGARMSVAGLVLIALPVAFNVTFGMLAARFDYPDVLRRPTHEVLARFREGGRSLVLLWWAFALTALALAPLAVLVSAALRDADATVLSLASTIGVLAAVVQFLGLIRWPFLVPYLAEVEDERIAMWSFRRSTATWASPWASTS